MQKGENGSIKVNRKYIYERNVWAALVVVSFFLMILFRNSGWGLRIASAVEVLAVFTLADKIFRIGFQKRHYVYSAIILLSGFIASPFYFIYPNYDKILHLIQPMLISSVMFFMINKLNLQMKWKVTFLFFVTFSLLGVFELGEYTLDNLFNYQLQGVYLRDAQGFDKLNIISEKIDDTMIDLFMGIIGTALYCAYISWIYKRRTHKHLMNYA